MNLHVRYDVDGQARDGRRPGLDRPVRPEGGLRHLGT
jgi:hypothetical protein